MSAGIVCGCRGRDRGDAGGSFDIATNCSAADVRSDAEADPRDDSASGGGALGSTDVVTLDSSAAEAFELAVDAGVRDSATSPFVAEEERATLLDNDAAEAFELDVDPIEGSNTPPRGTGRGVMTELKLRGDNKQC